MADRRKILGALAAGMALPAAAAAAGWTADGTTENGAGDPDACGPAGRGPNAGWLPNFAVDCHDGSRALFYDDLLAGRVVMVNCMSVLGDADYPVTANLARVAALFGPRLGREVSMVSLTVDPEHDSPAVLREFAARHGAPEEGWRFVTGAPEDLATLRARLFVHRGAHRHGGHGAGGHGASHGAGGPDCSLGLVRYGNEAVGLWGSVPAISDPAWIVERLSWVMPRPRPAGPPRRRGPLPLGTVPAVRPGGVR